MRRNSSPSGCATSAVRSRRARRPITVYITWLDPPVQFRDVSMCRENTSQFPNTNFRLPTKPDSQLPIPTTLNGQLSNESQRSRLGVGSWRWLGVGSWASGVVLQLPELGEFQEHGIRVHQRDCQTHRSVEESATEQIVPQERRRRVRDDAQRAG